MKRATLITAAFFLMSAGQTWADPIVGVTFNSSGGATQWTNETSLGTTNNLPYETGANSGISLTTSVVPSFSLFSVSVDHTTIPTGDSNLGGINGNFYGETSFTAALSGLHAGATYDVWVFVTRQNDPTNQSVTITGAGTTSFSQIDGSTKQLIVNSLVGSNTHDLRYYALPIVSDGSGDITIKITNTGSYGAAVSGIALQSVPEPGTLGLAVCGAVSLAAYGWRRRKLATM